MNPDRVYDLLLDRVGTGEDRVVEAILGLTWTLCRTREAAGLAMSPQIATRTLPWPGTVARRPVGEVAAWVRSWNPHEAVMGMAAVNAALNRDLAVLGSSWDVGDTPGPPNLAIFEHFKPRLAGRHVAVIGRYPGMERFSGDFELAVLERLPGEGDLPDPACEYVLPRSDWVFITASSIPNKTFPRLAELARDAQTVLMGPGTPWLPELAEFGIDYLAGVRVVDEEALRRTVAEGGGVRIFGDGVRYFVARVSRD